MALSNDTALQRLNFAVKTPQGQRIEGALTLELKDALLHYSNMMPFVGSRLGFERSVSLTALDAAGEGVEIGVSKTVIDNWLGHRVTAGFKCTRTSKPDDDTFISTLASTLSDPLNATLLASTSGPDEVVPALMDQLRADLKPPVANLTQEQWVKHSDKYLAALRLLAAVPGEDATKLLFHCYEDAPFICATPEQEKVRKQVISEALGDRAYLKTLVQRFADLGDTKEDFHFLLGRSSSWLNGPILKRMPNIGDQVLGLMSETKFKSPQVQELTLHSFRRHFDHSEIVRLVFQSIQNMAVDECVNNEPRPSADFISKRENIRVRLATMIRDVPAIADFVHEEIEHMTFHSEDAKRSLLDFFRNASWELPRRP